MKIKKDYRQFDFILIGTVIALGLIGIMIMASIYDFNTDGMSKGLRNQILYFSTGLVLLLAFSFIDYMFICKFYWAIYGLNIFLLVIVKVLGKAEGEDLSRSLDLGFFSVQPSEFAKIFMIIFLASLINIIRKRINHPLYLLGIIGLGLLPMVLVYIQPSLSASLVLVFILCIMLFIGKVSYKYIISFGVIFGILAFLVYYDIHTDNPFIYNFLEGYQITKIETMLDDSPDPDRVYQITQAMAAFGSGNLTGKGWFNGNIFVPKAMNDFVFTMVGQEFGFVGCIIVLVILFILIIRCILIAWKSELFLGKLIAATVAGMFLFHVFVNIGVNIGILPNTGMTLPFLSSGGSSMWVNMALVGMVINIKMTKTRSMFDDL